MLKLDNQTIYGKGHNFGWLNAYSGWENVMIMHTILHFTGVLMHIFDKPAHRVTAWRKTCRRNLDNVNLYAHHSLLLILLKCYMLGTLQFCSKKYYASQDVQIRQYVGNGHAVDSHKSLRHPKKLSEN